MTMPQGSLTDLRAEVEATKERNRLAILRFIEARNRFRALRDGQSDFPVFPVGTLATVEPPASFTLSSTIPMPQSEPVP